MAFLNIRRVEKDFTPAALGTDETKPLFSINKGECVRAAFYQKLVLASATTDTTVTLGDGGDPDGYIAAIDTEAGSAGDVDEGSGAYLAASSGKVYNSADTIDAVYDSGTTEGTIFPRIKFVVLIERIFPG